MSPFQQKCRGWTYLQDTVPESINSSVLRRPRVIYWPQDHFVPLISHAGPVINNFNVESSQMFTPIYFPCWVPSREHSDITLKFPSVHLCYSSKGCHHAWLSSYMNILMRCQTGVTARSCRLGVNLEYPSQPSETVSWRVSSRMARGLL